MKFLLFMLTALLCVHAPSYCSVTQPIHRKVHNEEMTAQDLEMKQVVEHTVSQKIEDVNEEEVRALKLKTVEYNKTAFVKLSEIVGFTLMEVGNFFLGAANAGEKDFALARAQVVTNARTCEPRIEVTAIAPMAATINEVSGNVANPLFDSQITNLTLMGACPVVTHSKPLDPLSDQLITLVQEKRTGTVQLTHGRNFLNDANGVQTSGIVSIASGLGRIFASVAPNAGAFGGAGSGVTFVKRGASSLILFDAQAGVEGNLAVAIDASLFELVQSGLLTLNASPVVLYWDEILERLFIGVSLTKGATPGSEGGVGLLVGRLAGDILIIEPATALNSALYTLNSLDHIFGYFLSAGSTAISTMHHINSLHTTTGKSYAILVSSIGMAPSQRKVLAVPVIQKTDSGDGFDSANVGKVAKNNDCTSIVTTNGEMTLATDDAALVGAGDLPIQSGQEVNQIFTCGNAVFAAVSQNRSAPNNEAGLFVSSALFDPTGMIRAWTPWQRVIGSVDKVFGAALDSKTGNYWYLTDDGSVSNTVKLTQWGTGESNPGLLGGLNGAEGSGLVSALASQFAQENAGVHQIFDFGPATPGFAPFGPTTPGTVQPEFSMMIAVGLGKLALIETGRLIGGVFTPNKGDFLTNLGLNIGTPQAGRVQLFATDVLRELGPLCAATVSCVANNGARGWVFVGGHSGLAVLSNDTGDGWDTDAGLSAGFVNLSSQFTFKKIGNFTNIKKLEADGQFLYVLTGDALYRITMDATKFDLTPVPLAEEIIATPFAVTGNEINAFLDFAIVKGTNETIGVLATTKGLYRGSDVKSILNGTTTWPEVLTSTGRSLGPVVHLFLQRAALDKGANLFATAADLSLNVSVIYQFDVQTSGVAPVTGSSGVDYFMSPGELRTAFITDGALGYLLRSSHLANCDFLKLVKMSDNPTTMRCNQTTINLSTNNSAHNIGLVVLNSASGARVVPGDWGIRVNE